MGVVILPRRDDKIISAINSLEEALEDETSRKEELRSRIDEVASELDGAERTVERIASERDDYRAVLVGLDETLETYLEADTSALDDMEGDLRDIRRRLSDLDIHEGDYTGGDTTIDIDVTINESRRGFLGKLLGGAAVIGGGAFAYETWQNSSDDIYVAEENIGEAPGDYSMEIGSSDLVEQYVSQMMEEENYSGTFTSVAEDINRKSVTMGYSDSDNRIDFYDDTIVSSVEMNDQLYSEAKDEMDELLQN